MNRPQPGDATLAAEIGLAESREVARLPEIERRACDVLPEHGRKGIGRSALVRVAMKFTGGAKS